MPKWFFLVKMGTAPHQLLCWFGWLSKGWISDFRSIDFLHGNLRLNSTAISCRATTMRSVKRSNRSIILMCFLYTTIFRIFESKLISSRWNICRPSIPGWTSLKLIVTFLKCYQLSFYEREHQIQELYQSYLIPNIKNKPIFISFHF